MVHLTANRHTQNCKTVVAEESTETFFGDMTPMLGRMSHFEKDGQILVPNAPKRKKVAHRHLTSNSLEKRHLWTKGMKNGWNGWTIQGMH